MTSLPTQVHVGPPPTEEEPAPAPARAPRGWWQQHGALAGIAFVLPMFALFVLFRFLPFLGGFGLAFANVDLGGEITFAGMANFQYMIHDQLFWKALTVTLLYSVIVVPLVIVVSIGLALLVRRGTRSMRIFRSVFFLPVITSLVLAGVVFIWIFGDGGPVPSLMSVFGLDTGSWLTNSALALPAVAIVAAWSRFGFDMLVVLARLNEIPRELEEAALVDGASAWQRFRHLTLPQLRSVVFFLAVIETITSFQVFDAIYIMTSGGPVNSTYTLGFMLYDQAFKFFNFGYSSAVSIVLFVIVLAFTLIQRFAFGRDDNG
ncbi:carbohydrate ABC transporter permease [Labedaea rhizosphaerae]|uniref:Carbohydrate ABC transporter membrane protein 1 (CUT1 family) n=1 Tax=Labedaea rhizosphaerae TaxID=598644 RepID=A0A4R6S5D7_LABRH|nr:sugar ABC transporter permease [Labedaea rhizosphaerae]TDP94962.1 carbohydrate ABC transporter membrane protein 1 (CUT1 family) [Labedaea rhizosphaerae]